MYQFINIYYFLLTEPNLRETGINLQAQWGGLKLDTLRYLWPKSQKMNYKCFGIKYIYLCRLLLHYTDTMLFVLFTILASIVLASVIAGLVVVFVATYKFQNRESTSACWMHKFIADGIYIFFTVLIVALVVTPAMFIIKPFLDIYALAKRIYNYDFFDLIESDEVYLAELQARFDAFFNPEPEEFFDCVAIPQTTPEPVAIPQTTRTRVVVHYPFNDGYGNDRYGTREFARACGVSICEVNF